MDDTINTIDILGENITPEVTPEDTASVMEVLDNINQAAIGATGVEIDDFVSAMMTPAEELEEEHEEEQEATPESDTIRPNSATLLVDETSSRFSGAIWAEAIRKKTVTLAGVGGIGSYVGFLLSRVKPGRIILYDPDRVESANMSGQLYDRNSVGQSKVSALSNYMMNFSCFYDMYSYSSRFEETSPSSEIMICGFDNMAARRTFYEAWKNKVNMMPEEEQGKALFIDGRLAAEEFQVFCIKGDDNYHMKQYEDKWLFSDEEAEETICSYKQTSHCANMIASVMVNLFVNFVANQCEPLIDRDVPFMTSYDASTMYFKTVS